MANDSDITKCEQELSKLYEEMNNLIFRIAGISDVELKSIVQEEYLHLEETINNKKEELKKLILPSLIKDIYKDFITFYTRQFRIVDTLAEALVGQLDLLDLCKKLRIRPITTLHQRRELVLLLKEINAKLLVLDYESNIIDTIGLNTEHIYTVYIPIFSKIQKINFHKLAVHII